MGPLRSVRPLLPPAVSSRVTFADAPLAAPRGDLAFLALLALVAFLALPAARGPLSASTLEAGPAPTLEARPASTLEAGPAPTLASGDLHCVPVQLHFEMEGWVVVRSCLISRCQPLDEDGLPLRLGSIPLIWYTLECGEPGTHGIPPVEESPFGGSAPAH